MAPMPKNLDRVQSSPSNTGNPSEIQQESGGPDSAETCEQAPNGVVRQVVPRATPAAGLTAAWFTYFIQGDTGGNIKIGKAKDVPKRLKDLQCGSGSRLVLLAVLKGDRESRLHQQFSSSRRHGEWFAPTRDLIDFILSIPRPRHNPRPIRGLADSLESLAEVNAVNHCGKGEWIPASEFEDWAHQFACEIKDDCERWVEDDQAEQDHDTATVEELEESEDVAIMVAEEENCGCDACGFHYSRSALREMRLLGFVYRPGMLCAVAALPKSPTVKEAIIRRVADAYEGFDVNNASLNLIFVDKGGAIEPADIFGAWLQLIRECDEDRRLREADRLSDVARQSVLATTGGAQ